MINIKLVTLHVQMHLTNLMETKLLQLGPIKKMIPSMNRPWTIYKRNQHLDNVAVGSCISLYNMLC